MRLDDLVKRKHLGRAGRELAVHHLTYHNTCEMTDATIQVPSSYIRLLTAPASPHQMAAVYATWAAACAEAFRRPAKGEKKPRLDANTFPWLPPEICALCEKPDCVLRRRETVVGACGCDVEGLLRGVGGE